MCRTHDWRPWFFKHMFGDYCLFLELLIYIYIFIKFKIHLQKQTDFQTYSCRRHVGSKQRFQRSWWRTRASSETGKACDGNRLSGKYFYWRSFWRLFSLQRAYSYHKGTKRNCHITSSVWTVCNMYVRVFMTCMTCIWHVYMTHMTRMTRIWHVFDTYMTRMTRIWHVWHAHDTYDTLGFFTMGLSYINFQVKWLRVIPCHTVSYAT